MSLPPTMTAAVTKGHGGIDMIEVHMDWPTPIATEGNVVIRVAAAAVNNTDLWSRQGAYGNADNPNAIAGWNGVPLNFPRIQGMDITGKVCAVGAGVSQSWLGKRVLVDPTIRYDGIFPIEISGSEGDGGFAQYHLCAAAQLHDVTGSPLTDAQLSCLPCAYGTAMGMINRAHCMAGQRVLVTGSSGGVGMAAIQLLVNRGCVVVAHTSESKRELVQSQGVAGITVRGTKDLANLAPVDVVVDVVGGDEFASLIDTLLPGGTLVTAGAIAGPMVQFDIRRLYLGQKTLIGSTMHTPDHFKDLAVIAREGGVAPLVAETYRLADIATAQQRFLAKDFVGKLVLLPWTETL